METFTGALLDPRSEEEKAKDYSHEEILGAGGLELIWKDKQPIDWIKLSKRDQNGSGSCGSQAGAKAMEFYKNVVESAVPIFRRRSNYPSTGMWMQEIGSILLHKGTTTEKDCPSLVKNDQQMDTTPFGETPDIISGYYNLPIKDKLSMDLIAQALEKGHAVIIGLGATYEEWKAVPVATDKPVQFNHFVCIIPKNYMLYNSEKSVIIDDSFSFGSSYENSGQRILTESFLQDRCWGILALIPVTNKELEKPKFVFERNMRKGYRGKDVEMLQKCLQYLGFFPSDIECTGYFGNATENAVNKLQESKKDIILVPAGLTKPSGVCGINTRAYLNSIFGII